MKWVVLVLCGWLLIGAVTALLLGRSIRRAEQDAQSRQGSPDGAPRGAPVSRSADGRTPPQEGAVPAGRRKRPPRAARSGRRHGHRPPRHDRS